MHECTEAEDTNSQVILQQAPDSDEDEVDHEAEASEELVLVEVPDEVVLVPVEDALSDPTEGLQQAESALIFGITHKPDERRH